MPRKDRMSNLNDNVDTRHGRRLNALVNADDSAAYGTRVNYILGVGPDERNPRENPEAETYTRTHTHIDRKR